MKRKTPYEKAQIEMVLLADTDIITASDGNDIGKDSGENDGEWW